MTTPIVQQQLARDSAKTQTASVEWQNNQAVIPAEFGGDCGQCGRPMYACTCDFGV